MTGSGSNNGEVTAEAGPSMVISRPRIRNHGPTGIWLIKLMIKGNDDQY